MDALPKGPTGRSRSGISSSRPTCGAGFAWASGRGAVRLLLLAPPGAGKGTQGERLAAWSGARHIAAGDLLRAEARDGGQLGREIAAYQAHGDLVPDQIVLDVLTPAVVEAAARGSTSWTASRGPSRRPPPRPNWRPGSE